MSTLELERYGSTMVVWMNRPPVNALNREMALEMNDALDTVVDDPSVRAVVLATRLKAFCGGADLKMNLAFDRLEMGQWTFLIQRIYDRLERLPLPTIAAMSGSAAGGGLELALACDIRVVAPEMVLSLPEVKRGILPGGGGTQRLVRMIGYGRALEIMITGRTISAAEAVQIGLAHQVSTDAFADALEFAKRFEFVSTPSIGEIKKCLLGGITGGYWHGSILEATASERLRETPEYREGIQSFLERRDPDFSRSAKTIETVSTGSRVPR